MHYPPESRGHYCRIILWTSVESLINYVPSGETNMLRYKQVSTDFQRMSIGLSSYPCITKDEWAEVMPHVNAEEVLIMLTNDGLEHTY